MIETPRTPSVPHRRPLFKLTPRSDGRKRFVRLSELEVDPRPTD
jgi:hypothetical protein